jgi:hypothetical protein
MFEFLTIVAAAGFALANIVWSTAVRLIAG